MSDSSNSPGCLQQIFNLLTRGIFGVLSLTVTAFAPVLVQRYMDHPAPATAPAAITTPITPSEYSPAPDYQPEPVGSAAEGENPVGIEETGINPNPDEIGIVSSPAEEGVLIDSGQLQDWEQPPATEGDRPDQTAQPLWERFREKMNR